MTGTVGRVDHVAHLLRKVAAFDRAVRRVRGPAPVVVSCPDWSIADLVLHLGGVHRLVAGILRQRLTTPPDLTGREPPPARPGWSAPPPVSAASNWVIQFIPS